MKPIFLFGILLLFLSSCSQKSYLNLGDTSSKNYVEEISFDFIKKKVIIPVKIGEETYHFVLDTGAPNIISKEFQEKMNYPNIQTTNITDANNQTNEAEIVLMDSLQIGNLSFINTAAVVLDFGETKVLFDCMGIDGIIGSNLLRNSIVQIDARKKILRLSDSKKALSLNPKEGEKLFLTPVQSNPFIWVRLGGENGVREQLLVDTGMNGLYDLSRNHYEKFVNLDKAEIFEPIGEGEGSFTLGMFGIEEAQSLQKFKINSLEVNQTQFLNLTTITTSDNNSRIGSDLLEYGIMTLDYKNKRFYFESYDQKDSWGVQKKDFGFIPTYNDGKLIVGVVFREELKNDMKYGDEILEIDGEIVNADYICEWIKKDFAQNHSDRLTIKIKSANGAIKDLEIEKRLP